MIDCYPWSTAGIQHLPKPNFQKNNKSKFFTISLIALAPFKGYPGQIKHLSRFYNLFIPDGDIITSL